MKQENNDLEKIRNWIESHNPFDENKPVLRSIVSGVTGTEGDVINCDDAESVGETIQHELDGILYSESKTKKKDGIKLLEALETTFTDREKRDIRSYFRYELIAIPFSLFQNSIMHKLSKAKLGHALQKQVTASTYKTDQSFHVLDRGALLHKYGDADTQIVSAALEYSKNSNKDVVVVAIDTNILVLLMFDWKSGMYITLHSFRCTKQKRGQRNVEN
ncbi:unnamed protein product [Lepeophtheirus salmonis]|uniref:(salmon louse) hypothetical protein n=1 Tax=Lepeophtheirus salmonis TaxID=72036 RepID=A0A7R8CYH8_LEPSM|nr:unnamed protein product [Lepeophtheirus salmonis]CAF2941676.1 unnamed protein product [Lepeophtheirus salmonis]